MYKGLFLCIFFYFPCALIFAEDDKIVNIQKDFISEGVDKHIKPCDDWRKFSCHATDNVDVMDDSYVTRPRNRTMADILKALKSIDVKDQRTPKFKIWLRTFYDQCLNDNATQDEIAEQVYKGVSRILGGTPPLLAKSQDDKDKVIKGNVWNMIGRFNRELLYGPIIDANVVSAPPSTKCDDKIVKALEVSPSFKLRESGQVNVTRVARYTKRYAEKHGINLDDNVLQEKAQKMQALETDLKDALKNTSLGSLWDNVMNYTELKALNPDIDWDQYFEGLLSQEQRDKWNRDDARFSVRTSKYFKQLDKIIKKHGNEALFNYVFWITVERSYRSAIIKDDDKDKQHECLGALTLLQSGPVARLLFETNNWNLTDWVQDINVMGQSLISSLKFLITSADWLNNDDKLSLMMRLDAIKIDVRIPNWTMSDDRIEKHTIKFDPSRGRADNVLNLMSTVNNLNYDQFVRIAVGEDDPSFEPTVTYEALKLTVNLGAAIPPYYNPKYPLSLKYGYLGTMIARQLDYVVSEERKWFRHGLSVPILSQNGVTTYFEKDQCIIPQLKSNCPPSTSTSNCTIPRHQTYAISLTIDALNIAYAAFKIASHLSNDASRSQTINDFDQDQLFFLAANRYLCSINAPPFWWIDSMKDDERMWMNKMQSSIPFRNIPAFAKAFKCSFESDVVKNHCGHWRQW